MCAEYDARLASRYAPMPRQGPHAAAPQTHHADAELPSSVLQLIGRHYFGSAAGAALFSTGSVALLLITLASLAFHDGVRNPMLGFGGLLVCLLGGVAGLRWGLALASVCLLQVGFLGWAEAAGHTAAPGPATPLPMVLLLHSLVIASGVAGGTLLSRVLDHYLDAAAQRERRFRSLLRLAVDWYWEQDENFRFTHVSDNPASGSLIDKQKRIGRTPWEMSGLGMADDEMAAHRADLEAHRPFSGKVARRVDAKGRVRFVSISGEPKFDAQGVFRGYWGVGRDVTPEMRTQHAVVASEARYRQLFQRSPTPLLMHRNGIVADANDAAARLFGFDSVAAMTGFDLTEAYDDDALVRVRERLALLETLPIGEGLPMAEFEMVSRSGRRLTVQATGVRVDMPDGPASMSLYFDITERVAAEVALRRSEALLSHLIATSPDCITLTDMASGRYLLVNDSFERLTGFSAADVIGRTSTEIGIWRRPEERARIVTAIRDTGVASHMPALFNTKSGGTAAMLVSAARFVMDGLDYLVINARDVTESERTRLEHDAILQNASIGIAFSRERVFQHANPAFECMFGWPRGTLAGQPTTSIWPDRAAYDKMRKDAAPVLSLGQAYELEREMRRADGSLFWCRMRGQALDASAPGTAGTIWIAEDVTERRQVDQALAAARDAAEAASRAKSAFLANTSHEIRTPLNGLLGLARLAMQGGVSEARRQQYLTQIFDSAQSLSGIISDILDLSKIEAGKIVIESVPFALREMLVAMHDAYQSLAEARGLELVLAITDSVPATVLGDPVRVRQIVSNYLSNALKFTERGTVHMHAGIGSDGCIRLSVSDTGPGIDAATQQRLFVPFTQADDSTTRRFGGTGLGLSICRELAVLMGGTVGVQSVFGDGATFWAELPLPETEARALPDDNDEAHTRRLNGARVLLVEDNPVNMMIAVALLEQWGVDVVQAFDGQSAVAAVDQSAAQGRLFDVVLMDVQMPRMSGHEAARAMRRRFDATELPIVALTAAALVSEREQAMASGMNEFLTKPIDAQRLRETLARAIARRFD
jgi:PAS domain S-box-containing protein